jgi:hypothetical protein
MSSPPFAGRRFEDHGEWRKARHLFLGSGDGRSRRTAGVANRRLGRLNWADRAPTRLVSGRTGVSAKAAVPCEREITFPGPSGAWTSRSSPRNRV